MPNNAYFGYHYQLNPNIIVVPTVSFSPPQTGTKHNIADSNTSSPTLNCEQEITPVKDNNGEPSALPCCSNCNQQNLPVVSSNSTSTKFSDNFKNSLCEDKISTETPAFNKSQNIQDLSKPTPKYKPRHNLVDLTGFNIPKREKARDSTSSLLKHKDLRLIYDPKIEQDKMKTSYDEHEHRDYSDSHNYKTDNISKEYSTNTKPTITYSERNTENLTCGEPKTNKTDIEDKMKKYFKQLWKHSFEKIKSKVAKEKHGRALKGSSKTTQEYKDSKGQSSRAKPYLQKVSYSNSTKDLRNKIIKSSRSNENLQNVSNSNPTKDLRNKIIERRFMAKYTRRSKSETNSRHLPDSKVSIRDRRIDFSPDSIKRYKDFQHFMRRNDDHEIKYKSRNQIKTENLPRKKTRMKSCETNKPVSKNNVDERKKSIKSEKLSKVNTIQTNLARVENCTDKKRAINQNNTDSVKLIKSVVRVNKNFHNNLSQRKRVRSYTPDGVEDLRLRLSRKRARNDYLGHYHEPMENTLVRVQESPMITVNQDVQADSKKSPILAGNINKPKLNKCKQIKLFINIVYPISDSDNCDQDLNECSCSSPDDLSFLNDFNIDEIVDSLNIDQVEPNKTITKDNDHKHNDQTKPKEVIINDVNMKATEIKKEETSLFIGQDIEISSDTVDGNINIEIGSVTNTKKCKDEQNMDENLKVDSNTKQEANIVTELPGKGYEEIAPKETMNLCKDEQNIRTNTKVDRNTKQEANDIIDLTEKGYKESAPKETMNLCKDEPNIKTNSKVDRNTKQVANYITDLNGKGYEEITPKETMDLRKDEKQIETYTKVDRNTKQEANNIIDLTGEDYKESAPKETMNLCKDEQNIKTISKVDRNTKQEANNKTHLTRKYCDKNAAKETMNLSDDDSVIEVIDISDENGHYTKSKYLRPIKPIQTSTLAKKTNLGKFQFKPSVNKITALVNKKKHNIKYEDNTNITAQQKIDPTNITDIKQTACLQTMFNIEQNKSINSIAIRSDVTKQLNTLDKQVKGKNVYSHISEDPVEASLEAMFNNCEQNGSIVKHIKQNKINRCDENVKQNSIQETVDAVEVSLETTLFNSNKHQDTGIYMDIEQPSSGQHIQKEIDVLQTAQVMTKVPLGTMSNIVDQNKNLNEIKIELSNVTDKDIKRESVTQKPRTQILPKTTKNGIEQNAEINSDVTKQLNTLDKQVKGKNVYSHISEDPVEASLEAMFNNCEQNGSIVKHIKQNKINRCDENVKQNSLQETVDAVEVSLETTLFNSNKHQDTGINMDIEQPSSGQHIQKEIDVLQTAQVMTKVPLGTMSNIVDQNKNLNEIKIELSNVTDKDIKRESVTQKPRTQILPKTTKNGIEQNAEIKINSEPLNVIKENRSRKSGSISQNGLETEENILEKANNKMDILCRSSKSVNEHLQIFEDTVYEPQDKPINKNAQKTSNVISSPQSKNKLPFDSGKSTKGILEMAKSFAGNCPSCSQIDIRPQSCLCQYNNPKSEPLQKSVETIKTSSKATIDNAEQKINIRSESNKSDKNIEEKTLLTLENSEVKSENSPERSNIQHKTSVTTSVKLTNPDKNIEVTSRKTSIVNAENSLTANNKETTLRASKKSNVENQTKSETVKNNTQKLETIDDACGLNKITIKDSELGKRSEIAANNKTKQEQAISNKTLFPDGSKSKDEKKITMQAEIFKPPIQNFVSKLESLMSEYLQKKYTFSSVIHNGSFSRIYKCFDNKGEPYAVKVVKPLKRGMLMEGMLFVLQKDRPSQDSFILYLISGLEVEKNWCLLTEYYPVNLKQALHGYAHGFHINRVQVLSRQLVDAVKMLTKAGVIHSDIKPNHILLNGTHDRLKLCGFDRSNYSSGIKITPSTGTPIYRAPEVILGFQEDHRIDLWSTALVMFEMATSKTLFTGGSNNVILYQQLCTFGSFHYTVLEQSRYGALHFYGTSFLQKIRCKNYEETRVIHSLQRNDNLRRILFQACEGQRTQHKTKWQMWNDKNKFKLLHKLLEQMLVLDPRNRLPIQFVCASEFMNN